MNKFPKGLRLDHGYLQVRIMHKGSYYHKNFGTDSPLSREIALIHLAEKRKEILLGKFGIEVEIPRKKFSEVAEIYLNLWSKETTPDGYPKHGKQSIYNVELAIKNEFKPFFPGWYERITPKYVSLWREQRVQHVLGTTANREQNILSSIFSHIEQWIKIEKIRAFQIPKENPCEFVQKSSIRKRQRVLSTQELSLLKQSCIQLNDLDMWEICKMALKSLLRKKDLEKLEAGLEIDTTQSKTGRSIHLPIQVLKPLNYANFRHRWVKVRDAARLIDVQFRDLRKTGANLLKMKNHSNKLISEFLGHSSTQTTEIYMINNADHLKPLAEDLEIIVESI